MFWASNSTLRKLKKEGSCEFKVSLHRTVSSMTATAWVVRTLSQTNKPKPNKQNTKKTPQKQNPSSSIPVSLMTRRMISDQLNKFNFCESKSSTTYFVSVGCIHYSCPRPIVQILFLNLYIVSIFFPPLKRWFKIYCCLWFSRLQAYYIWPSSSRAIGSLRLLAFLMPGEIPAVATVTPMPSWLFKNLCSQQLTTTLIPFLKHKSFSKPQHVFEAWVHILFRDCSAATAITKILAKTVSAKFMWYPWLGKKCFKFSFIVYSESFYF